MGVENSGAGNSYKPKDFAISNIIILVTADTPYVHLDMEEIFDIEFL